MRKISFSLFTVVVLLGLVKLGFWQLERAEQKEALLAQLDSPRMITHFAQLAHSGYGDRVSRDVQIDSTQAVLLDNQMNQGKVGYRLFMPVFADATWVLADLGWLAAPIGRQQLPAIPSLSTTLKLEGILSAPSDSFVLAQQQYEDSWPQRVQKIEPQHLASYMGKPLVIDKIIHASQSVSPQLEPSWQPIVVGPERHYGYAVQWFGLAIAISVFFIWWIRRST